MQSVTPKFLLNKTLFKSFKILFNVIYSVIMLDFTVSLGFKSLNSRKHDIISKKKVVTLVMISQVPKGKAELYQP